MTATWDVGAQLRARRQELGLTQEELGRRIGWLREVVSDYERGRRRPTLITLCRWAEALFLDFAFSQGRISFHPRKTAGRASANRGTKIQGPADKKARLVF